MNTDFHTHLGAGAPPPVPPPLPPPPRPPPPATDAFCTIVLVGVERTELPRTPPCAWGWIAEVALRNGATRFPGLSRAGAAGSRFTRCAADASMRIPRVNGEV